MVSTNAKDILKFWGGLLVALLGLVFFVGGGFMSAIFASKAILMLVGLLLLIVGGYVMYKACTHHEFDEVVNQ
jgi:uncharacterized membrane protein